MIHLIFVFWYNIFKINKFFINPRKKYKNHLIVISYMILKKHTIILCSLTNNVVANKFLKKDLLRAMEYFLLLGLDNDDGYT